MKTISFYKSTSNLIYSSITLALDEYAPLDTSRFMLVTKSPKGVIDITRFYSLSIAEEAFEAVVAMSIKSTTSINSL